MNNVYGYIQNLASTSKRTEKEVMLKEYLQDPLFVKVVTAALDKRIMYNIKEIPQPAADLTAEDTNHTLESALDSLNALSERWVTGNQAIGWLSNVLFCLDEQDRDVLIKVVSKDLRCGVSIKTINKVAGFELIYDHPYMNYQPFNEKNMDKVKYPAFCQPKLDGLYVDIVVRDGNVKFMTRNGLELPVLHAISEQVIGVGFDNCVLQGEGLIYNEDRSGYLPRKEGNGIFNSAEIANYIDRIIFVLWDYIPIEDFDRRQCDIGYADRISIPKVDIEFGAQFFEFIRTRQVANKREAYEYYEELIQQGMEGAVLKEVDLGWRYGVAKGGVKMKPVKEADLIVVGWTEGSGKYEGGIGSLCCRSSDGLIEVNVAGLSDGQRGIYSITNNGNIIGHAPIPGFDKDRYNGKIITVKYNEIITNEHNPEIYSLFLPRTKKDDDGAIEFRYDKDEADTYPGLLAKEKGG